MKIILLEDVKALGKKGEVVTVQDGYARNFILPKKLGVEANNQNLNELKLQQKNSERVAKEELEQAKALGEILSKEKVLLTVKTGESGKIFGSITNKEIAVAIQEQLGHDIDRRKIMIKEPIKMLGSYEIPVKLHREVTVLLDLEAIGK